MKNCPFYGCSCFTSSTPQRTYPFVLMATNGNQCGLVTTSHSPCHMEVNQLPVDWRECPLVKEVRIGTAAL
jgi:hypothetical protein